ncbi:MAG TPA: zf-HC2 domain-containing protein [Candidatus Omnitrophota bacterium]|nr:zf-HC2 domain-containing protein [Candidatus Omnitrophota bacterium]HRZ14705.1 zf-HC2 domain-containing protein [Candidatus Omnitrophota bacterium]
MECPQAKELLSQYLDDMLEPQEKAQLEQHLEACSACKDKLAQLKRYAGTMAALPKVKAPADFLEKVQERIERRSEFESVIRGFFKPSPMKTKVAALAMVMFAMIAVYKMIAPEFTAYKLSPAVEKRKALGSTASEEVFKSTAPVVADAAPRAESRAFTAEKEAVSAYSDTLGLTASAAANAVELQATLTALDAQGRVLSLNEVIDVVTRIIGSVEGQLIELTRDSDNQARFTFKIPAIAYPAVVKQLEQLAAVSAAPDAPAVDQGWVEVILSLIRPLVVE